MVVREKALASVNVRRQLASAGIYCGKNIWNDVRLKSCINGISAALHGGTAVPN